MTRWKRWVAQSVAPALAVAWMAATADGAAAPTGPQATVRSAKALYRTNEPITGAVTAKNPGKEPLTLVVRAWLEWELDQATRPQQQSLAVEPGKEATASFRWRRSQAVYGHALRAEVLLDGRPIARGADFFNVCDDYWNVALIAAMSAMHWIWNQNGELRADLEAAHRPILDGFRRDYFNGFEHFFWGEDDFLGLTPRRATWFSGQARYHGASRAIRVLIGLAHADGLAAVTYAKLTGGGPYGAEIARQHPEWVWNTGGVLSVGRGVGSLARWEDPRVRELPSSWNPVNWNINDPRVLEIGIRALADSTTMFGWDGARWDGNFDVQPEVRDLKGKLVEKLTPDQVDARNAANMRRTKACLSKPHPRFFYGYNWCQGNWCIFPNSRNRNNLPPPFADQSGHKRLWFCKSRATSCGPSPVSPVWPASGRGVDRWRSRRPGSPPLVSEGPGSQAEAARIRCPDGAAGVGRSSRPAGL